MSVGYGSKKIKKDRTMKISNAVEKEVCIYERNVVPTAGMMATYKLIHDIENGQPENYQDVFSVEILFTIGEVDERLLLSDIAREKSKALEIIDILADGGVDSCTAPYIIDELLSRPEFVV